MKGCIKDSKYHPKTSRCLPEMKVTPCSGDAKALKCPHKNFAIKIAPTFIQYVQAIQGTFNVLGPSISGVEFAFMAV